MHSLSDRESGPVAVGSQAGAQLSGSLSPGCACQRDPLLCQIHGPHLVHAGVVVTQVFGFHLLLQVMSLREVAQAGIV